MCGSRFGGHVARWANLWINGPSESASIGPSGPDQTGYHDGYLQALDATTAGIFATPSPGSFLRSSLPHPTSNRQRLDIERGALRGLKTDRGRCASGGARGLRGRKGRSGEHPRTRSGSIDD